MLWNPILRDSTSLPIYLSTQPTVVHYSQDCPNQAYNPGPTSNLTNQATLEACRPTKYNCSYPQVNQNQGLPLSPQSGQYGTLQATHLHNQFLLPFQPHESSSTHFTSLSTVWDNQRVSRSVTTCIFLPVPGPSKTASSLVTVSPKEFPLCQRTQLSNMVLPRASKPTILKYLPTSNVYTHIQCNITTYILQCVYIQL